jgi:chromate transporter
LPDGQVSLATIAREWTRIGCIGFGGPPTHIVLLRKLCVSDHGWISMTEFEDGIAATNLLPGPASTQLAILCAWRLRRRLGALVGGVCFIAPGLIAILALSALFLAGHPPLWAQAAAAGAGAAVAAVALNAAFALMPGSWKRIGSRPVERGRWLLYASAGGLAAATTSPYLVFVLIASGLAEVGVREWRDRPPVRLRSYVLLPLLASVGSVGGIGALIWEGLKVGALSYGGGFVIVPLMQSDAVTAYHWMTNAQFLNAVALGQITPGPVVQTIAAVGYAAAGLGGGVLAAVSAFTPSFLFVLLGAPHLDRIRAHASVQAFLTGAGSAAIGAIAGSAVPLGLALAQPWQVGVLAAAFVWFVLLRHNVVVGLVAAGVIGVAASFAGLPVGP